MKKNNVTTVSGMVFRKFLKLYVLADPGAGNRGTRVFQAILAQDGLWHLKKSRARAESGKPRFPGARGPKSKKKSYHAITTPSGMVVSNFFTFYVLPDRTPTGGKPQNTGILGHFGLGRPLALRETPGLGRKQKNAICHC